MIENRRSKIENLRPSQVGKVTVCRGTALPQRYAESGVPEITDTPSLRYSVTQCH